MATFSSLAEAREYFQRERFATSNGMTLEELSETRAVCAMEVRENHLNALDGVMGGAIFTLADLAFAVTANQIHSLSVASQVSINYLSAPKGTKLIANAKCLKTGRTTSVIQVDVTDDTGRDVALFIGTAFKK